MVAVKTTPRERAHMMLVEIAEVEDKQAQIEIAEKYISQTFEEGEDAKESEFKAEWRSTTSKFITRWFYVLNATVILIVVLAFFIDMFSSKKVLETPLLNPTVLVALIGGTVAQTAAVFILFARYSLNFGAK